MRKAPIKLIEDEDGESVTYESQMSTDKRTFVVRIESTQPMTWYMGLQALFVYTKDEIKKRHRRRRMI